MKIVITIISAVAIVLVLLYIFFKGNLNYINTIKSELSVDKTIPNFTFYTENGEPYTNKNLNKSTATLIIYFNTNCEYCQNEAKEIVRNSDNLRRSRVIFVSNENKENLKKFKLDYNLDKLASIDMLHDPDDNFYKAFRSRVRPSVFIYDSNNKLLKSYKGTVPIQSILKYLK